MKKNDYCMMKPLSGEEHVQVSGGYVPPTEEQMEELRKIYGPLADLICWQLLSGGFWDWVVGTFLGGMLYDLTFHTGETIESFNAGRDAANAMWNK